ncbi:MAG TPA: methyltransferase [Candidatus Methylomirabilis sp.]|nr:methyltransferase [Candidatus Methylomirabilis sp.]
MAENYLPKVRELYEAFPFPSRDPATESPTAVPVSPTDILGKVNHHGFGGRRDFTKGFRGLVAGGGTGDAAIFLAAQLREADAEVVCLDLSEASLAIARRRAALRGLEQRVRWVPGSILDVARLGLGRFDYISCLGVLHHLADPDGGLRALEDVLAEDGAMGLMVYGRYGRLDIYAMQDLMRLINRDEPDLPAQVANLKAALRGLSPVNLLLRGRSREQIEALIANEGNLVDTFLHAQDRAYTVPELYRFVEAAGLSVVNFTNFGRVVRLEYEPDLYLADATLRARLAARPAPERQAIAELLHGHMFLHTLYAARPGRAAASFRDPDMVPFFLTVPGAEAAERLRGRGAVRVRLSSRVAVAVAPSPAALACLALVDGVRPLAEIWRAAAAVLGEEADRVAAAAAPDLDRFNAFNWLCLRHRSCPPPPSLAYGYRGDAVLARD